MTANKIKITKISSLKLREPARTLEKNYNRIMIKFEKIFLSFRKMSVLNNHSKEKQLLVV